MKVKTRSEKHRNWNIKGVGIFLLPLAIAYGLIIKERPSQIGMFILYAVPSIYSLIHLIRNPWVTKVEYTIYNSELNDDGTTTVEWVSDDMKEAQRMNIGRPGDHVTHKPKD